MKIFKGKDIKTVYTKLIKKLKHSKSVGNTKEINNCILVIKNPTLDNLSFGCRNISESYVKNELEWYWSADNSCKTIGKHAKMWLTISDDGKTSNSAYGYIIHKKYGFDQLKQVIKLLKKDNNTRRAVINISDPSINRIKTKDMQCTIALQFLIRNNELEMTTYMRSNDVYFGLPYDYIYFVSIGKYIAKQLKINFSKYIHNATSMHMYNKDIKNFVKTKQMLNLNKIVSNIIKETSNKRK